MQKGAVRFTLLALLLGCGLVAAFFIWDTEQRIRTLDDRRLTTYDAVERLTASVTGISAVQQAYVDYGLRDTASFVRVSTLLDQIVTDGAALRSTASSPAGAAYLDAFWSAIAALTTANTSARESLEAGEPLAAADVLLGSSRPQVATLETSLRGFRQAEAESYRIERKALVEDSWITLAGIGALWTIALIAFAPVRTRRQQPETVAPVVPVTVPVPVEAVEPVARPEPRPAIDLDATAALCAAISRLTDAAALPALLERAARILDARGIIIWMAAGEELFAVSAHGYGQGVVSRFRPIGRTADNATAAAWREGEIRTVAGDAMSHGAIVAPLLASDGAIGVFAAEVRHGREDDAATKAVAAIIASQLATVLPAWPAANVTDSAVPAESDRQAAAS